MIKCLPKCDLGFFSILTCMFIFSACQKEYDPGIASSTPTPTPNSGSFTAVIGGTNFTATARYATRQSGVLLLYGKSADNKEIVLRVADSGVHNYSFSNTSFSNAASLTDSSTGNGFAFTTNQWPSDGNYGNMNVTSIDTVNKTMSGTFSLKVFRDLDTMQRTITQGVFTNISYTTSPPPTSTTDSFRVKVDGTPFVYNILAGIKTFGMLAVTASNNGAPTVGITMPETVSPGTYAFDGFTYIGQYNASQTTFLAADTGHVTILEHNVTTKRIRGTFQFKANTPFTNAPPDVQLTEGYFSVIYQ